MTRYQWAVVASAVTFTFVVWACVVVVDRLERRRSR